MGEARGNISVLSRRLGVCTKTMYRWLRSANIDLMNFRRVTPSIRTCQNCCRGANIDLMNLSWGTPLTLS